MQCLKPVVLQGERIILKPLEFEHAPALCESVRDGELWKLWYTRIPSPEQMTAEIQRRLDLQQMGSMLPFTVEERDSGRLLGMTTFMNIEAEHRRVEIGSTWYRQSAQRSYVNTECKIFCFRMHLIL